MKLLLEVKEDKAAFLMQLLENFKFVKTKPLTPLQAKVHEDLKDAVDEVNDIKAGKKKSKPLSKFLDEL